MSISRITGRALRVGARSYGRGCGSTLGGRGDGSEPFIERRTMLNATAPPARTATAAPAISHGRLLRWCFLRACCNACGRFATTSCAAANSWAIVSWAAATSRASPALLVAATHLRRGRLHRIDAKPDYAACDIYRADRRVRQASGQPLPGGQLGRRLRRLRTHLPPFYACRPMLHQPATIATPAGQLRACSHVFGWQAVSKRTGCGPGAGVPARGGRL